MSRSYGDTVCVTAMRYCNPLLSGNTLPSAPDAAVCSTPFFAESENMFAS